LKIAAVLETSDAALGLKNLLNATGFIAPKTQKPTSALSALPPPFCIVFKNYEKSAKLSVAVILNNSAILILKKPSK
jgi:hypothetical protein